MMIGGASSTADDPVVVVDDGLQVEPVEERGISAERLDLALGAGPARREHFVAPALVP